MTLAEWLSRSFERFADRPAVAEGGEIWTYAELHRRCLQRAEQLRAAGLLPGDRVAAYLPNSSAYLELYLACVLLGLTLVPLNLRLHQRELRSIFEDSTPALVVRDEGAAAALEQALIEVLWDGPVFCWGREAIDSEPLAMSLLPELDANTVAQIYYTSGTTGRPKGVVLKQCHVAAHAEAAVVEFQLTDSDVWGHFAPMFHLADAWACFGICLSGGAHCFLRQFEPKGCFEIISQCAVTLTNLVPTMLQRMVGLKMAEKHSVDSLRLLLSGGAPIAPELVRRVQERFQCEYVQTYGLTETSPFLTVSLLDEELSSLPDVERFQYASRTGRAFGGIELRVIAESGLPVAMDDSEVGEIQARGPWVFESYWRHPAATRAAFDQDWFLTGDLATIEARGFLNIVDRKKDIILSGGETVYSTEVENALYTHQLVEQAAAFPMKDDEWGEVVAVAVVRRTTDVRRDLQSAELVGHCRLFLAPYKVPRLLYFLDEFPLTGSGKVQKRLLRERCRDLEAERLL